MAEHGHLYASEVGALTVVACDFIPADVTLISTVAASCTTAPPELACERCATDPTLGYRCSCPHSSVASEVFGCVVNRPPPPVLSPRRS